MCKIKIVNFTIDSFSYFTQRAERFKNLNTYVGAHIISDKFAYLTQRNETTRIAVTAKTVSARPP